METVSREVSRTHAVRRYLRREMMPTRFELAVLLVMAGVTAYQLLAPPLIGLADSGDFERVIPQCGLAHFSTAYKDKYFDHFNSTYRVIKRPGGGDWYKTSTSVLIRTARWFSIAAGQRQLFDIRVLAALYSLLFLVGIWLALVAGRSLSPWSRFVLAGLLVLIFTDVGYVAYFNSFYSEATAFSFLAVGLGSSLVLIAQRSSSVLFGVCYFAAVVMMITSKPQYVPLAPAFALFGVYLFKFVKSRWKYWICAGLAAALCCIALWYYAKTPPIMRVHAAYVEIFMDLLPNSSTPQQDLVDMGLNPEFAAYTGTTPYQPDSPLNNPIFHAEFAEKSNSLTVPLFYLARPDRLYQLCRRCMRHAFSNRVKRLGYYEASTGKPPRTQPFGLWSATRESVVPRSVLFLALFLATGIVAVVCHVRSGPGAIKGLCLLYLLFVLVAAAQFFVSILAGGGEPDLEKHLFMFNFAFDSCLILSVLGTMHMIKRLKPVLARSSVE